MASRAEAPEPLEQPAAVGALEEIERAITLVLSGVARRVQLYGLPSGEQAAALGAVHAQARGVAFRLERDGTGAVTIVIGPRRG